MAVRCPDVIGRDRELSTLRDLLRSASRGQGCVAFVSGEPGVGKSRLVQELLHGSSPAPGIVLSGRATATSSHAGYRPFAEILARIGRDRALSTEPELTPWRPALQAMLPTLGATPTGGADATALVCGEALLQVLRLARAGQTVVVVLEDLHWADPDTVDVLEYLADNLAAEPVLCLATLRDEPSTPALDLARRTSQRGLACHLQLDRLTDADVVQMVAACAQDATTQVTERVRATADGVPLLVEEVLATPGVPASVGEAVRTRVATLTEDERQVLYAAAVLGRDFDWKLLPAVSGQSLDQVTSTLERLVATMLVSADDGEFRFRHALTREAVVAMLLPPRRAAIARTALDAVDRLQPDQVHAELALQAEDRPRAGTLLAESGRAALRRGALGTAVDALHDAVALLDEPVDAELALVEALALAGRFDEALQDGERLLERLGADHPTAPRVHVELAHAAVTATRWPAAGGHLDAARELLAVRPDPRLSEELDVLDAEVALANSAPERAREAAQRALSTAEAADAAPTVCHALELIGRSLRVHDLDAAREAFDRAHRTAQQAGLPVWRLRALHELGTIELLDHAGTDALLQAREAAEQQGALSTAVVLDVQLAAAYHLTFDLDAAHARARDAASQSSRLNLAGTYAIAQFFDAGTSALRGDRDATVAAAAAALRAAPGDLEIEGYVWAGATGLLELLWGDRTVALDALDRGMTALHTVSSSSPGHYRGLWALLHAVDHHPDAADRIEHVRQSGVAVMRPNAGYLDYADAVLTRSPDAVAAGDAHLHHVPVWHHLGRMHVARAALTDGWGTPGQWLREARVCFETYRLDHLARHCTMLLGETPSVRSASRFPASPETSGSASRFPASPEKSGSASRFPASPEKSGSASLTKREAEVLELVAEGLANKQIATRLHLSVRTVEKHVESLLRKAGAQSRTHLIALLRETT